MSDHGVFTTFLIKDGVPIWLDQHIERMRHFSQNLGGTFDRELILHLLSKKCTDNEGSFRGRIIFFPEQNRFSVTVEPYSAESKTLKLKFLPIEKPLGDIKKWPFQNMGFQGGEELLLVDSRNGDVLEGNHTNIFVQSRGKFYTPPADGRILNGICRQNFISLLRFRGIEVIEKSLSEEFINRGEIFLSNSLKGIRKGVLLREPNRATSLY